METLVLFVEMQPVGHLLVAERGDNWIRGHFVPDAQYDRYRILFEEAARLWPDAYRSLLEEDADLCAMHPYFEVIAFLTHLVILEGVDRPIKDFELFDNGAVYVILHPLRT